MIFIRKTDRSRNMIQAIEYEKDFYAWLMFNVGLIRDGRLTEVDAKNIAEELEGMGISQRHQLVNRLVVLIAHLLKWKYQSLRRSSSWRGTIIEQRRRLRQLVKDSPSLKYQIDEKITEAYQDAVLLASNDTGIPEKYFPSICPFTFRQVMDDNFYPEPEEEK